MALGKNANKTNIHEENGIAIPCTNYLNLFRFYLNVFLSALALYFILFYYRVLSGSDHVLCLF